MVRWFGWQGPSPPRASPALLSVLWASLVRVPLSLREGDVYCWAVRFLAVGVCLIDLRGLIADLYLIVGRGRLVPVLPLYGGPVEVTARARKMGSMGFAMETLPVPGFPGTSGLPRPPLQAEVCRAGG